MIGELRDVLEKQIVEFKQFVNNRFCMLQRQQNIFLQFILEYAVSSVQGDDVRVIIIILLTERIKLHLQNNYNV